MTGCGTSASGGLFSVGVFHLDRARRSRHTIQNCIDKADIAAADIGNGRIFADHGTGRKMRHADQLTGPGAQDRAIDHGHPVERPPGREATCQQLIQLVAAGLDGCRQFVEMPAVNILNQKGLRISSE